MDDWQIGRMTYLIVLGSALVFWFILYNRQKLGRTLQQAAAWGLIFLGVIAAIGLWDDIRQTVRPSLGTLTAEGRIQVPRARDGHYYLTLTINQKPVEFLVDTGATDMVLTMQDAERAKVDMHDLAFVGRAMTANGPVRTAPVRLDLVSVGPVQDRNVRAWVNEGDMAQSLLGMAYLQRWSHIEITNNALVLTR